MSKLFNQMEFKYLQLSVRGMKTFFRSNQLRSNQGSALLLTILITSLLLMIVLSFTIMVRIELRAASAKLSRFQAEANAKLGAYLALASLQKYAGPDQRVSTTGDVLDTTHATKGKYTVIWGADPATPSTYGKPLAQLASQAAIGPVDLTGPTMNSENWTELLSARRAGQADEIPAVRVENVDLTDNGDKVGSYAWWIGDEGVKASVGLRLPEYAGLSPLKKNIAETDSAFRYAINSVSGLESVSAPEEWAKVFDRSVAVHLDSSSPFHDALEDHFHDITARTYSVLSDVRTGKLKKDLTAGLESGRTLMEDDTGLDSIFPPQWGGAPNDDPGGPLWEQLRDFYHTRVSGTDAGSISMQKGSNTQVAIAPVLTWMQVYVHASRANSTGDTVRFYLLPAFALWNPYQHDLTIPSFKIAADLRGPGWKVRPSNDPNTPADESLTIVNSRFPALLVWEAPSITFAPGEVKMFSMNQHQEIDSSTLPSLNQGWWSGYGVYQDVRINPPVTTDLELAYGRESGNAGFYLFTGNGNTLAYAMNNAFAFARGLNNYRRRDRWYPISGSGSQVGPGAGGGPLVSGSSAGEHGNPMPRIGYQAAAKFAKAFHDMGWINGPAESSHLAKYNIRSSFSERSPSDRMPNGGTGAYNTNPLYSSGFQYDDVNYAAAGSYATGYAATLNDGGLTNASYFQFLREDIPTVSIGQFMHAELTRTVGIQGDVYDSRDPWIYTNYQPAYAIGNSLSDPRIPNDEVFRNWSDLCPGRRRGTHYDQSYLLNDALWDSFYLSGIPREGDPFQGGDGDGIFDQDDLDLGYQLRLPNPCLTVYGFPPIEEVAGSDSDPEVDSYSRAAEHLLLEGALNINSTSTEAWTALFMSFIDENVRVDAGDENNAGFSPLTRSTLPTEGPFDPVADTKSSEVSHSGYRRLTQIEAEDLASNLVTAIRARVADRGHPFLSMSEFINRSLSSSTAAFRQKGVMQQAIDASSINDALGTGEELTLTPSQGNALAFRSQAPRETGIVPENVNVNKMFGLSSYVMAADIFAKFGHMLTPRSDTFLIRSYGESNNPLTGDTHAEAYCEMLVQRVPDVVTPSDAIQKPTGFGRKFEIVSARWLDHSEL